MFYMISLNYLYVKRGRINPLVAAALSVRPHKKLFTKGLFMKTALLALMLASLPFIAQAEEIRSADTQVNVGRVVDLVRLTDKSDIQVSVAVVDLGGSTDVSPTQAVYLTIYKKGEMFSTDASFHLGDVIAFAGAKRVSGGIYEVKLAGWNGEEGFEEKTYVIDARKAIVELKNVQCGDEFDCDASENFSSKISMIRK